MTSIGVALLLALATASARGESSGVLFYAGFEGTADAVAVGDGIT